MSGTRPDADAGSAAAADPAAIEQQIEATREEMTETIEAIQERLAPEQLAEQAAGVVRELAGQATTAAREATLDTAQQVAVQTRGTAQRVRGDLWSTTTQHPMPGALIAVALGWLWRRQSRSSGGRYGGERQQSEQGLWQLVESNPLAAGALGLVLGGVVGLVIPETERERQLMGETRDRLMHEARMAGTQAIGSVQERALGGMQERVQEVTEQAVQTVVEKARDVLPPSGSQSRAST